MSLQSDRLDEFHSCTAEHPPSLNSTINSTVANIDSLRDATNYISYRLGQSMSIFGNVAIIGATANPTAGKAFVFERDNGVWSHVQTLQPSDGSSGDHFGQSVSLSESYIIVGASSHDTNNMMNIGAAYVFERSPDDGIWVEVYKLIPTQTSTGIRFGNSVSLAGDQAVVGASGEFAENGNRNGAAYYFTLQSIASSNPSMTPSAVPSISFQPSPSNGLSSSPSGVPSFTPSDVPSLQPSAMPSDGVRVNELVFALDYDLLRFKSQLVISNQLSSPLLNRQIFHHAPHPNHQRPVHP